MSDVRTRADGLRVYLSGASAPAGVQQDSDAALGGYSSRTEVVSLGVRRLNPIPGITILYASGENGPGTGQLTAMTADSLQWKGPGDADGAVVEIANGETKVIESDNAGAYLRIRRDSTEPLQGTETVVLVDVYGNAIGLDNVIDAEAVAGDIEHRAVFFVNETGAEITNLKIWQGDCDPAVRQAKEAPAAGAVQTIADEDTAPTGLTWNAGTTSGTGLSTASLPDAEEQALWLERTIAADAAAAGRQFIDIRYEYTLAAVTFTGRLRGAFAIARDDAKMYGVWIGVGAYPDLTAPPDEVFTADEADSVTDADPGLYYLVFAAYSTHGLESIERTAREITVTGSDSYAPTPPSAPSRLVAGNGADGKIRATGIYEPAPDGDNAAHSFPIWLTVDGSTPDPSDPPTAFQLMARARKLVDEPSFAFEQLNYLTDADYFDLTPVKFIARARRFQYDESIAQVADDGQLPESGAGTIETSGTFEDWDADGYVAIFSGGILLEIAAYASRTDAVLNIAADDRKQWGTATVMRFPIPFAATDTVMPVIAVDSTNTTVTEGTLNLVGPARPSAWAFFGRAMSHAPNTVGPSGNYYLDEPNNVRFVHSPGDVALYGDDILAFRLKYLSAAHDTSYWYLPDDWSMVSGEVSGAGTGAWETLAWTGGDKRVAFNVNGVRSMIVDFIAKTITTNGWQFSGSDPAELATLPSSHADELVWPRYADTLFQVFDPYSANYLTWAVLTVERMALKVLLDTSKTTAEIEAL